MNVILPRKLVSFVFYIYQSLKSEKTPKIKNYQKYWSDSCSAHFLTKKICITCIFYISFTKPRQDPHKFKIPKNACHFRNPRIFWPRKRVSFVFCIFHSRKFEKVGKTPQVRNSMTDQSDSNSPYLFISESSLILEFLSDIRNS